MSESSTVDTTESDFEAWSNQVERVVQRVHVRSSELLPFTINARYLLTRAANSLRYKNSSKDALSLTTLFFAAIEWGNSEEDELPAPPALVSFARQIVGSNQKAYLKVRDDFFETALPRNVYHDRSNYNIPDFEPSQSLSSLLTTLEAHDYVISSSHLIKALLDYATSSKYDTLLSRRLDGLEVDFDELNLTLNSVISDPTKNEKELQPDPSSSPKWIFRYSSESRAFVESIHQPGHRNTWELDVTSNNNVGSEVEHGDTILFWRSDIESSTENAVTEGISGWGVVERYRNLQAEGTIQYRVLTARLDDRISLTAVSNEVQFSIGSLIGDQDILRIEDQYQAGFQTLINNAFRSVSEETYITDHVHDRPEKTVDLLQRAPIAFVMAHFINRIWDRQSPTQKSGRRSGQDDNQDDAAFVIHIDAPWGGGKTTFANFISEFLTRDNEGINKDRMQKVKHSLYHNIEMQDTSIWSDEYLKRKWITVRYNAWQNQHVSPPWWNFYEVIRGECLSSVVISKKIQLYVGEIIWRIWTPVTKRSLFMTLILGLIAYLIVYVANMVSVTNVGVSNENIESAIQLIASGGISLFLYESLRRGLTSVAANFTGSLDAQQYGESDPLEKFRKHFKRTVKKIDRPILVIVDDLDRCDSRHVVEIARGILTIFRSPRVVFLLLGDKSWIEKSFANVYEDMLDGQGDEEFGGLFVEKSIQLTYILPEPQLEQRKMFTRSVLGVNANGAYKDTHEISDELSIEEDKFEQDFKEKMKNAKGVAQTNEVAQEFRKQASEKFGNSDDLKERTLRLVNHSTAVKTASSDTMEHEIRHSLMSIESLLPSNPRQIKRIINMIATYQASAQAALSIDQGTREWKQMVLWIILMSEHYGCWKLLLMHPTVADDFLSGKSLTKERAERVNQLEQSTNNLAHLKKVMTGVVFVSEFIRIDKKSIQEYLRFLTPPRL